MRETVDVRVADRLQLEVALEVGGTVEEVTVSAETPLLDTANGSLGNVVDARRISELPTAHGDPYTLIGLAAGVSYTGSARLDRPFEPTHIVGYAMDGTRGNRSDLTIDGVPSTATANAGEVIASYVPPPDIVQEFKVQTATFDAALGNTEGGVTNLSIKAGSNSLRGTAYFAKTPRGLFANDYFANANNIPLADFTYNRYGGTRRRTRCCSRATTAGGGRSSCTASRGSTRRGRATTARRPCRPRRCGPAISRSCWRSGRSTRSTTRSRGGWSPAAAIMADPFPGNIIPQSLINPVARAALEYIGMPRTAGARRRHRQLPEPVAARDHQVRHQHHPRSTTT